MGCINEKKAEINIELNKVCYFPEEYILGTIIIFPKLENIEPFNEHPELIIKLEENQINIYSQPNGYSNYTSKIGINNILIDKRLNLKDSIIQDYSAGIKVPFSVQIPKRAYPTVISVNINISHIFIVEIPCCNVREIKNIVIKNTFPENVLIKNIEKNSKFKKSKLCSNKGSISCKVKLPKNYFFYNENIPFEVNIDCSKLDLKIKGIKVILFRIITIKMGKTDCCSYNGLEKFEIPIIYKDIPLEKGLTMYNIFNFINFYPLNAYEELEKQGLDKFNDEKIGKKINQLFPCCNSELISIVYFLKIQVNFDTLFTSDENIINIPLYFTENDICNPSLKNQVFNSKTEKFEIDENLIKYT